PTDMSKGAFFRSPTVNKEASRLATPTKQIQQETSAPAPSSGPREEEAKSETAPDSSGFKRSDGVVDTVGDVLVSCQAELYLFDPQAATFVLQVPVATAALAQVDDFQCRFVDGCFLQEHSICLLSNG